jgi:hypothetical protein
MHFTTKEMDICDRQKHGKCSQFVLDICVTKKKLKTVKIRDEESFYIHDTSIRVVLNQGQDEELRHCQIQVFTYVIHLHQWF